MSLERDLSRKEIERDFFRQSWGPMNNFMRLLLEVAQRENAVCLDFRSPQQK